MRRGPRKDRTCISPSQSTYVCIYDGVVFVQNRQEQRVLPVLASGSLLLQRTDADRRRPKHNAMNSAKLPADRRECAVARCCDVGVQQAGDGGARRMAREQDGSASVEAAQ